MKTITFVAMLLLAGAAEALAQQGPSTDLQARFLLHKQVAKPGIGFAGWAVASDVTNPAGQRALLVAGVGYKWKGGWVEVMPGAFAAQYQRPDPVLDVRSSFNLPESLNLSVELLRAFRTERTIASFNLTVPVPGTDGRLRVGVESDLIFRDGPDGKGGGWRIGYKFSAHGSLAVAYQFRFGVERHVIRSYCLFSF